MSTSKDEPVRYIPKDDTYITRKGSVIAGIEMEVRSLKDKAIGLATPVGGKPATPGERRYEETLEKLIDTATKGKDEPSNKILSPILVGAYYNGLDKKGWSLGDEEKAITEIEAYVATEVLKELKKIQGLFEGGRMHYAALALDDRIAFYKSKVEK